jgi:hypothetical protein
MKDVNLREKNELEMKTFFVFLFFQPLPPTTSPISEINNFNFLCLCGIYMKMSCVKKFAFIHYSLSGLVEEIF